MATAPGLDLSALEWGNIALNSRFRSLTPSQQAQFRAAWLRSVAPMLYPGIVNDPEARGEVARYAYQFPVIPKRSYEDEIFTPNSYHYKGWDDVEDNPSYKRLNFAQQQEMKNLWFQKMARRDPEFQEKFAPEEQSSYFHKLMARAPGVSFEGLVRYTPTETLWDSDYDPKQEVTGWQKFLGNISGAFVGAAGAIQTAAAKILSPEGDVARWFSDAQKVREWQNVLNTEMNFLTRGLPSFVGGMGGLIAGPYGKLAKGMGAIGSQVTSLVLPQLPSAVGSMAGGTAAYVLHTMGSNVAQDKPWSEGLGSAAAIGVGFRLAGNLFGALRMASKAAKQMGVPMKDLVRPAMETKGLMKGALTPELEAVLAGDPALRMVLKDLNMVDSHGFRLETLRSKRGVEMISEVLGLKPHWGPEGLVLTKLKGTKPWATFQGPEQVQIRNAVDYMLNSDRPYEMWMKTAAGKQFMEQIATHPSVEAVRGTQIPELARQVVKDFWKSTTMTEFGGPDLMTIKGGGTARRDVTKLVDEVISIVTKKSVPKATEALAARGILFDVNIQANKAAVAQLKAHLNKVFPSDPYVIVNSSNKANPKVVSFKDLPAALMEDPRIKEPFQHSSVFVGNGASIRAVLTNLKKLETTARRNASRIMTTRQGTVEHLLDNDAIEMRMVLPDAKGGLHNVIAHFPTAKSAELALRTGTYATSKTGKQFLTDIFQGLPPGVEKSYMEFMKALKRFPDYVKDGDFGPYAFAVKMGKQAGYQVGTVGGRYVVEDVLNPGAKWKIFNDLNSLYKFLTGAQSARDVLPDLAPGVSRSAIEAVYPDGIPDPTKLDFSKLEKVAIKAHKAGGLTTEMSMKFSPTQYVMERLDRTEGGQWLAREGMSPTRVINAINMSTRAGRAFEGTKGTEISSIFKGFSKAQKNWVTQYTEALDTVAERTRLFPHGVPPKLEPFYRLKSEVFDEMVKDIGQKAADDVRVAAVKAMNFLDQMFVYTGQNWGTFHKHYMPHIRAEAAPHMDGLNSHLFDYLKKTGMTDSQMQSFYTMMRGSDPGSVIFEQNAEKLLRTYTHLAARDIFLKPVMEQFRGMMKDIIRAAESTAPANKANAYNQIVRYMSDLFNNVEGMHNLQDLSLREASKQTLVNLAEEAKKLGIKSVLDSSSARNIIDTMITWSTGAHLAGKGFTAFRNLTQNLVTGAPVIGLDWWLAGVEKTMAPGALAKLESLGIISRNMIPVAGWDAMPIDTFIKKAVSVGMAPFKSADAFNRAVVYHGMTERAMNAVNLFAKDGNIAAFARRSGAKLFGPSNYNELVDLLNKAPNKEAGVRAFVDRLGFLAVQRTQYLYEKFNQPQLFREGIGRWAGQYTSWPLNFINLVSEQISPSSGVPILDRVKFMGTLAATTGAISYGLYEMGLNPASWNPLNMASFGWGPQFSLAVKAVEGISGGDRDALFDVVNILRQYYPYAHVTSGIYKAVQAAREGEFEEMALHLIAAPLNYDVYPKRDEIGQDILNEIYYQINKYAEFRQYPARMQGRINEAINTAIR